MTDKWLASYLGVPHLFACRDSLLGAGWHATSHYEPTSRPKVGPEILDWPRF
jgi:hypothetical protein